MEDLRRAADPAPVVPIRCVQVFDLAPDLPIFFMGSFSCIEGRSHVHQLVCLQ